MASAVVFATLLVLMTAVATPVFAADHTVGGASGWDSGVDYSTWAAGETFNAKDTLSFSYTGLHSVHQVSKTDYESCSSSNAITSSSTGASKFTLDKPGTNYYFICGTTSHCLSGMKLAVTTAGGSGTGSSDSGGSSTSTPTTPAVTRGYGGYSVGAAAPASGGAAAVVLAGVVAGLVAAAF